MCSMRRKASPFVGLILPRLFRFEGDNIDEDDDKALLLSDDVVEAGPRLGGGRLESLVGVASGS
jgi:hypothetical protein